MKYYILTAATALTAVATIKLLCCGFFAASAILVTAALILNDWRNEHGTRK